MSVFAKLNLETNEVIDVFEFETDTLPEIMGNPAHYILATDTTGIPSMGGTYNGSEFLPAQPYPSWVLVDGRYQAPINLPDDFSAETNPYHWDESLGQWVQEV